MVPHGTVLPDPVGDGRDVDVQGRDEEAFPIGTALRLLDYDPPLALTSGTGSGTTMAVTPTSTDQQAPLDLDADTNGMIEIVDDSSDPPEPVASVTGLDEPIDDPVLPVRDDDKETLPWGTDELDDGSITLDSRTTIYNTQPDTVDDIIHVV